MTETRRSTRRILATGSRFTAGIAVIAAGIVGLAIAIPAPLPQVRATPAQTAVAPHVADVTLVCPGPFRALGRDPSAALAMQGAGTVRLITASDGAPADEDELAFPDLDAESGPAVLRATAGEGRVPMIAAAQSLVLRDQDLFGLAAAACRPPSMQAWLVGGAASVGASDVLVLANPGSVPSTVTMTVFAAQTQTPSTVIVPARTQIAVPLAASAVGESAPVVRVVAEGAPVHAVLQSSLMRTLDPAGVALQDDAGVPSTRLVIAGVQVTTQSEDVLAVLRMMATANATEATVSVYAADEAATLVSEQRVPLAAQMPTEVEIPTAAPGVYTVVVTASEPLVAAAWQATGLGARTDFTWMTPAPELRAEVLFAVPQGGGLRLHLFNDGATAIRVVLREARGEGAIVTVPAGGSIVLPLIAVASYVLSADGPVRAAVIMSGNRSLAGWPLWPEQSRPQPILVFP